MIITNNNTLALSPGMKIKVIQSESGARGAEGKIGIFIGYANHIVLPYDSETHGLFDYCPYGFVIKLEKNQYWNIGTEEVILETIEEKENEMIIKDFEISKSGKGITVNFVDGTYKKSYAVDPDEFDVEKALYICLAKKYSNEYKCDDIEELAKFFAMTKKYIKEVERVFAEYKKAEEVKKIITNRKAKKIRYKANKKAREREEMIEIQK